MDQDALIAATAVNLAAWHESLVRALGFVSEYRDGFWLTPDPVPGFFFSAITVRSGADAAVLGTLLPQERSVELNDTWADLPLVDHGFSLDGDHPWMVRGPGTPDVPPLHPAPTDLMIERVSDATALADFEHAEALGFGMPPPPAFTWRGPDLLADPRMIILRGCLGSRTVAGLMAFVEAGAVGIYGVSTIPEARRRGYAEALMRAALSASPDLPSVLQPGSAAERIYRRLGYERFTTFRTWSRPAMRAREGKGAA